MFKIRYVAEVDKEFWFKFDDSHFREHEFELKVRHKQAYIICDGDKSIGIMRYNFFWDIIPFLTMINIEKTYHSRGFGKQAVLHWENEMLELGHKMTMTSTQADEGAQHFYRKLGYEDMGCLVMANTPYKQPLEIFLRKNLIG